MWKTTRDSGIILHPTSLPSPYGMGDIGPQARLFADTLVEAGQNLWQILPLGPTSYGDSPYQSPSTFAGNPMLISFDDLVDAGLLSRDVLDAFPDFPQGTIEYGPVLQERQKVLGIVCQNFDKNASPEIKKRYTSFCRKQSYWLNDYALFMAIKEAHGGGSFTGWPSELIRREEKALKSAKRNYAKSVKRIKIQQFLFADQWARLKQYCNERDIQIIGDVPIFVAHDSADVWASPELFYVDASTGRLKVQAGVPPDYFSATGQLWGNPLYDWDYHKAHGFEWWQRRLKKCFELVDFVRIDHFRGFAGYWEVPANAENAINGRWVKAPGQELFETLREKMGDARIIAEDLGVITPDVEELRDNFELPGMRVVQFAFGFDEQAEAFRPHNYPENCVAYTGTHDNDTIRGWFNSQAGENSTRTQKEIDQERWLVCEYVHTDGTEIEWDMISVVFHSRANTALAPMQDLLGLGSESRMNVPGCPSGNWTWRFQWDQLLPERKERLRAITESSGRMHR